MTPAYDTHGSWSDWIDDNGNADDATKLTALREFIADTAQRWTGRENITSEWLNKKLAKLGVPDRIVDDVRYELTADVTAPVVVAVYATSRAEALTKWAERLSAATSLSVGKPTVIGPPSFTAGPDDPATLVDPDAPTTVDATLAMLREVIMLGHIAGPKFCESGANSVLAAFGLAPIPAKQSFRIERPVTATATTDVMAYDLESAERVAGWRWENGQAGHDYRLVNPVDATA